MTLKSYNTIVHLLESGTSSPGNTTRRFIWVVSGLRMDAYILRISSMASGRILA